MQRQRLPAGEYNGQLPCVVADSDDVRRGVRRERSSPIVGVARRCMLASRLPRDCEACARRAISCRPPFIRLHAAKAIRCFRPNDGAATFRMVAIQHPLSRMLARLMPHKTVAVWRCAPGLAVCFVIALISVWLAQFGRHRHPLGAGAGGRPSRRRSRSGRNSFPASSLRASMCCASVSRLLGLQVSQATLHALSFAGIAWLCAGVVLILAVGWIAGPLLGIARDLSMVLAASVAICGASAAAAFALVFLSARQQQARSRLHHRPRQPVVDGGDAGLPRR